MRENEEPPAKFPGQTRQPITATFAREEQRMRSPQHAASPSPSLILYLSLLLPLCRRHVTSTGRPDRPLLTGHHRSAGLGDKDISVETQAPWRPQNMGVGSVPKCLQAGSRPHMGWRSSAIIVAIALVFSPLSCSWRSYLTIELRSIRTSTNNICACVHL
jgi:hypothetical protein